MNVQTQPAAQPAATPLESRSLVVEMASQYGLEPRAFVGTLKATLMPKEASIEDVAAFLMIARKYNLNPFLREIFAFPRKGGGVQTIVSIDGWTNLINSHPQFDGAEFCDQRNPKDNKIEAITCKIYRKDRQRPIAVTEYLAECKRGTDVWQQWPMRMLRHRALIQCARYAFGFAGLLDPDEADFHHMRDVTPRDGRDAGPPLPSISAAEESLHREEADTETQQQQTNSPQSTTQEQQTATDEAVPGKPDTPQQSQPGTADDLVKAAAMRGWEAHKKGTLRKALPPEYREPGHEAEATAWQESWDRYGEAIRDN